LTVTMISHM